jgi:predicted ATPase
VTLTGTGGVGKTRLSLAVAAETASAFADGVALVELAPLLDADAVMPAVADAVDAVTTDEGDLVAAIVNQLRDQQLLLVLDNFEHLLAAAPSVASLIESVPGLSVLVTSRAPLRVRGETEVTVDPLTLPSDDGGSSAAVDLFLERAQAVAPGWGCADDERADVVAICHRLAGIPLALELAAARTRFLDPATLVARLDDVALDGARDLPARQRTMTATLDWSHGLLEPDERALLRLLSVFSGGVRLDDLEAVAALSGTVQPADVLRLLHALSEQSLVVSGAAGGAPIRHRLLEPVAQYARAKLEEVGEKERATQAHAEHFLQLAEQAAPEYQRAGQVPWLARIDAEHANLTAAMERLLAHGQPERAARCGWALWMYWWLRGHLVHGRRQMEAVLKHDLPDLVRAKAELAAATVTFAMDDIEVSRARWAGAAEHAGDDPVTLANATAGLGLAALASGDVATAGDYFRRALPLAEAGGAEGEWTAALTHTWLGTVAMLGGDEAGAAAHIAEGLKSARQRGDRLTIYVALYNLSQVEVSRGRPDVARRHLDEGMRLSVETGDQANLAYFLDSLAVLEAGDGMHARVPLLLGAAQGIREAIGSRGYGYYRPDPGSVAGATEQARRHLGGDRYDDALDVGRAMSAQQAAELALGERGLTS